jgi:hypothetical protein
MTEHAHREGIAMLRVKLTQKHMRLGGIAPVLDEHRR